MAQDPLHSPAPRAGPPLRIALLSFEYPPETGFGGIGSYTWHHARGLAALGHEVHVLAGAREPTPLRSEQDGGVHVHRYWASGPMMGLFNGLGKFRLWWTRQRLQNAWSMYQGLRTLHHRHAFDVVEMPECGAEGALVTRLLDIPSVVRLHSPSRLIMGSYDVRRLDIEACSALEQPALRHATALTSCSRFLADEVTDKLGVLRQIAVITNGLDVGWFDQSSAPVAVFEKYQVPRRPLTIVFTGRMERRKGIHLLPEIAGHILERHDVSFVLAGADLFGYVQQTLLPALASRPLKGSIHWLGPLPLGDLRPLVAAADIFLLPSLWENCPYSCLEAMAAGRAIVCANQGGMPELIRHEENGLLAVTEDAASFTAQVERLVGDAELRRRLGRAARATLESRHDHVGIARQTVEVYRRVMRERPRGSR
ncbi:MAG: glycosyltransferase family 4 protein [Vicinamibacterales bacterium]